MLISFDSICWNSRHVVWLLMKLGIYIAIRESSMVLEVACTLVMIWHFEFLHSGHQPCHR